MRSFSGAGARRVPPSFVWVPLSLTATLGASVLATFSHGGRPDLLRGTPWPATLTAGLLSSALVARGLVLLDVRRDSLWLGLAAAAFLDAVVAGAVWISLVRASSDGLRVEGRKSNLQLPPRPPCDTPQSGHAGAAFPVPPRDMIS